MPRETRHACRPASEHLLPSASRSGRRHDRRADLRRYGAPLTPPSLTRNFVAYLASRFASAMAMTMLRAGVAWHVFALTGSAFHLGLIGLVQFLPVLALTLVGGVLADTYDRRRIMLCAQATSLTCGVVLLATTARGIITLPLLYAMIVAVSAAGSFDSPARMALLPMLVGRERFPRLVTIASTNQALAFASGPAVGGLVIGAGGVAPVYAAYAALVVASLTGLAFVRPGRQERTGRTPTLAAVREGLRFVRRQQVVLGCMTLDMFAVIFGGASALLPIYASEILRVGPRGYGMLSASLEIGALLTSMVLMSMPPIRCAGRALLLAVGTFGVATIAFGLSRWFPLSVVTYMLAGAADQVSVVMRVTMVQLVTPDELRGRVSAVNMLFIGASNQLGAAESGFVAAATNAPFAVVSGGIGSLLVLAVVAARMPALRRYRTDFT